MCRFRCSTPPCCRTIPVISTLRRSSFPDDEAGEVTDSSTFRQSSAFKAYLDELRAVSPVGIARG